MYIFVFLLFFVLYANCQCTTSNFQSYNDQFISSFQIRYNKFCNITNYYFHKINVVSEFLWFANTTVTDDLCKMISNNSQQVAKYLQIEQNYTFFNVIERLNICYINNMFLLSKNYYELLNNIIDYAIYKRSLCCIGYKKFIMMIREYLQTGYFNKYSVRDMYKWIINTYITQNLKFKIEEYFRKLEKYFVVYNNQTFFTIMEKLNYDRVNKQISDNDYTETLHMIICEIISERVVNCTKTSPLQKEDDKTDGGPCRTRTYDNSVMSGGF